MKALEKVAVIGAGIMGSGIAAAVLRQGPEVRLFDSDGQALERACGAIRASARRGTDSTRLVQAGSLEEAVREADLVLEAVVEDLEVKCALFERLGRAAPGRAVLASNTSSLSISRMARASGRPERFVGLHFFNPALIMRLVELIVTPDTAPEVAETVQGFLETIRKVGVKCRESPGFVVNRILIPVINEAFHLLEERSRASGDGLAEAANDIDSAVLKERLLPMGPFDLADLTGLDTIWRVARVIHEGFGHSPRYRPPELLGRLVGEGRLGRKSGCGVYRYGSRANDPDASPPLDGEGRPVERSVDPGFPVLDLVCVIVNEACRVLEEGIVDGPEDIERSMELGTRWARGPFRLADEIGRKVVLRRLEERFEETGGDLRYEPSGLLRGSAPEKEKLLIKGEKSWQ